MRTDNQAPETPKSPKQQTGEQFGKIKNPGRSEDDFKGKSDTPRGSEPEIRGESGRRG